MREKVSVDNGSSSVNEKKSKRYLLIVPDPPPSPDSHTHISGHPLINYSIQTTHTYNNPNDDTFCDMINDVHFTSFSCNLSSQDKRLFDILSIPWFPESWNCMAFTTCLCVGGIDLSDIPYAMLKKNRLALLQNSSYKKILESFLSHLCSWWTFHLVYNIFQIISPLGI